MKENRKKAKASKKKRTPEEIAYQKERSKRNSANSRDRATGQYIMARFVFPLLINRTTVF